MHVGLSFSKINYIVVLDFMIHLWFCPYIKIICSLVTEILKRSVVLKISHMMYFSLKFWGLNGYFILAKEISRLGNFVPEVVKLKI